MSIELAIPSRSAKTRLKFINWMKGIPIRSDLALLVKEQMRDHPASWTVCGPETKHYPQSGYMKDRYHKKPELIP